MPQVDVEKVASLIRDVAAEEIVPKFARLDPEEVREKAPGDLVTAVDLAAERRLTLALPQLLPGARVIGEEAVSHDRAVLNALVGEAPVWIVDPLDGTANFSAGLPIFCVIVALVAGGETQAGWIHDPMTGRTAAAERGGGAWIDGRRLRVHRPDDLRQMTGSVYGRKYRLSEAYRSLWAYGRGRLGQVFNARCVGQEYLARLQGGMHFGVYTRLNPWDHAAGCLLHEEAGGYVARFDGSPYRPTHELPGILVTPDAAVWDLLHRSLIAPAAGSTLPGH